MNQTKGLGVYLHTTPKTCNLIDLLFNSIIEDPGPYYRCIYHLPPGLGNGGVML